MIVKEIRDQFEVELSNGKVFYLKEEYGMLNIKVDGFEKTIKPESTGYSNTIRIDQEDK